ncbi:hypothetical protein N8D56_05900 [Devosia sp. A8/3-2]|nr:hypothetical protein N8D56_05900 [Devosia sp. A8/3-2]
MRLLALAPLALALLATPVWAQTEEPVPTDCTSLLDGFGMLERGKQTTVEDTATGCIITNVYFGASYSRMAIGQITLDADDLFGAIAGHTRPAELKLSVTDIRVSPDIDSSPLNAYIIEMQAASFDLNPAYRWDEANGDFTLEDFSMRMPTFGSAAFRAELSDVRDMPAELEEPTDFARGNIEKLTLTLDNRGLFTAFFAPVLLGTLPYDEDPRPHIAATQKTIIALIEAQPEAQISASSKTVLTRFVTDFPKPDGLYQFEITPVGAPVSLESSVAPNDDMVGLIRTPRQIRPQR